MAHKTDTSDEVVKESERRSLQQLLSYHRLLHHLRQQVHTALQDLRIYFGGHPWSLSCSH